MSMEGGGNHSDTELQGNCFQPNELTGAKIFFSLALYLMLLGSCFGISGSMS